VRTSPRLKTFPAFNQKAPLNWKGHIRLTQRFEILLNAVANFPQEAAIPYNLACYYCQRGEIENAKRYLGQAFEIDPNWRKAAL